MMTAHRPNLRAISALCLASFVLMAPAQARAIDSTEAKCRSTIAKALGKYVKALEKAIIKCHGLRDKGKISSSFDCNDTGTADAISNGKVSAAMSDATATINAEPCTLVPSVLNEFGRCPAPWQGMDDPDGAPNDLDSLNELAFCLELHAQTRAEGAAIGALGLPSVLGKDQQKCHGAIGKAVAKVINTTVSERAKCQNALNKDAVSFDYACATADPNGKIQSAIDKAEDTIAVACQLIPLDDVDSCASSVGGLHDCALGNYASAAGGGMASMFWELPGECPASGTYQVETTTAATDLDVGWRGFVHDMDPILGYGGVRLNVACDADCANCNSTSVTPAPGSCRCNGDASIVCSTNGDCGGSAPCQCFYNPPAPYHAAGSPVCVTTQIDGSISGSVAPATSDLTLDVPTRNKIFLAISQGQPCPLCVGGLCDGGQRDNLACSIDATDATFGDVSYDCPPVLPSNVSGSGVTTTIHYTTGSSSVPFSLPCDPPFAGLMCACSICTLNSQLACNSDAECIAAGAGTCRIDGVHSGEDRKPNGCDDFVCNADPSSGPNEGKCTANSNNTDKYCSGLVRSNGEGLLTCSTNADCTPLNSECPGNDCGTCSLSKVRDCFLDPIVGQGEPGRTIVGTGCIAFSNNVAVNAVTGWPGPYRIKQRISADVFCSDGITPFQPPGGSNCP